MKKIRKWTVALLACLLCLGLVSCVNQHPSSDTTASSETEEVVEKAADDEEEAGETETEESETQTVEARIVATTVSIMRICDMLELELVGIPTTDSEVPERYAEATSVGTSMSPDMEIIASLEPTDVLMTGSSDSSSSVVSSFLVDKSAQIEALNIPVTYLNVSSVEGLYETITLLGEKYGKEELAAAYVQEYEDYIADFQARIAEEESPTVLILMGLPGSYIEATAASYVGALVEMAGGTVVVVDASGDSFVSWNTEELYALDPDYILLTVHGIPSMALAMFEEEFSTNTIWQNFRAVQEGNVYQLDYTIFGMSASFDWMEALEILYEIFYEGTAETFSAVAS